MKTFLLFPAFFLCIASADAQNVYVPGKLAKGETVTYSCCNNMQHQMLLTIRNVNNRDTSDVMYFNDGSVFSDAEYGDFLGETL